MIRQGHAQGGVLLAMLFSLLLVAGLIYMAAIELQKQDTSPIRHVRIEGLFQNLEKIDIQTVLAPLVQGNGFWALDLKQVESVVTALPWVDTVRVDRVWPDTLALYIEEQVPWLRWGRDDLLNVRGERFTPPLRKGFDTLVLLQGPDGFELNLVQALQEIETLLAPSGLAIGELIVNERRSWFVRLTNGVELALGYREPVGKLQRFLKVLPMLGQQRIDALQTVDLRYPNGFAVSWKAEAGFAMELAQDNVVF